MIPKRVPYVQQLEAADCGAACLTMVLQYHGIREKLKSVREALGTSQFGVNLHMIVDCASRFGLRGRPLRVPSNSYRLFTRGMILHWEFNHFVVFDRVKENVVRIVDPGVGYRSIPEDEFLRSFTGLALHLEQVKNPDENDSTTLTSEQDSRFIYFKYLGKYQNIIARILAVSLVINLVGVVLPAMTGYIVDRVIAYREYSALFAVGIFSFSAIVFNALAFYSRSKAYAYLKAKIDVESSTDFIEHLLKLPYTYYQRRSVGDLMLRIHSNTSIREILNSTSISALLDSALVLLYALMVWIVSPLLAAILLFITAVQIGFLLLIKNHMSELASAELLARSTTHSQLVQMLTGIQTLKGVGAESEAIRIWINKYAREVNAVVLRESTSAWVNTFIYIFEITTPFIVLWTGAYLVLSSSMTLGTMLALSSLSIAYIRPLSQLVKSGLAIFELSSHIERIRDVTDAAKEHNIETGKAIVPKGNITISGLRYKYDGAGNEALNGIDLDIKSGQHIALVGQSGCGKSTIFNLLLGLYKPDEGTIKYDGHDLQKLSLTSVRRNIGIVPQNTFLFENSIRNNIALTHPEASMDEIVSAAKIACIHDDITQMFNGYETRISANGDSVSGGQKQRIALARAILSKPNILVLDEATSALDAITEGNIVSNLKKMKCTRIIVAHRLSTIRNADSIVMMKQGRIIDMGPHEQLVTHNTEYKKLLATQIDQTK